MTFVGAALKDALIGLEKGCAAVDSRMPLHN